MEDTHCDSVITALRQTRLSTNEMMIYLFSPIRIKVHMTPCITHKIFSISAVIEEPSEVEKQGQAYFLLPSPTYQRLVRSHQGGPALEKIMLHNKLLVIRVLLGAM